jgi:hypothetical protein
MCGRDRLTCKKENLAEHFGIEPNDNWQPPRQRSSYAERGGGSTGCRAAQTRWLNHAMGTDSVLGEHKMINAPCETIVEKPTYGDVNYHRSIGVFWA